MINKKINFGKYVRKGIASVVIKGVESALISFENYDSSKKEIIFIRERESNSDNEKLHYEEIDHSELEEGDVYYCGSLEDAKKGFSLKDFRVHMNFYNLNNYSEALGLREIDGTNELLSSFFYEGKVVRFY